MSYTFIGSREQAWQDFAGAQFVESIFATDVRRQLTNSLPRPERRMYRGLKTPSSSGFSTRLRSPCCFCPPASDKMHREAFEENGRSLKAASLMASQ
jgi:hypothetical protein